MQQCNETITVINRKYNPETDRDDWIPTVIHGASWHNKVAATVTQTGLHTADTATVRIPVGADAGGATYMPPAAYKAAESASGAYTLARGDYIIRGDITAPEPDTPTTATAAAASVVPAEVLAQYEDHMTILSVTDNTRRPHGAHRKVMGA